MSKAIDELKDKFYKRPLDYGAFWPLIFPAILALDSRLTALERTVADYNDAVDAITAWADGKDRQAYEKAIKEIPDEPDRAEIVERYAQEVWHRTAVKPEEMGKVRRILNDLLDEVTHERP